MRCLNTLGHPSEHQTQMNGQANVWASDLDREGVGLRGGFFAYEKNSNWVYSACSPEFAVGNFAPTCCEPAFGKARIAILQCLLVCFSFVSWEFCDKCCFS